MADAVGGLLQGFNSGLASGLDFYKTIQGEARAKRQEQVQAQRYATEDERWERNWDRQVTQDAAAAKTAERNFAWDQEKFKIQEGRLSAAAKATADYRASQHRLGVANYNLKAASRNDKLKAADSKKWDKELSDALERGKEAFSQGSDLFMDTYSSDYRVKIATNKQIARANGLDLDDDTAASLHVVERPEGGFIVTKRGKTENGEDAWLPFDTDPDRDGLQAMVMPSNVFAQTFGGSDGTQIVAKEQALSGAQSEVASLANSQFQGNNAEILAKTAEAEQQIVAAEQELQTLSSTPAYITTTDYRGQKTTRPNPELNKLVPGGPEAVAARKAELQAQLEQSQGYVSGMLGRQESAKGSARATLAGGLDAIGKTAQGLKPTEVPVALGNTVEQLRMGNKPSAEQLGKAPDAALDVGMGEASDMRGAIQGMVKAARPVDDKKAMANEGKMIGSIMAAAEQNGGIKQLLGTPNGQALTMQIAAQMHDRNIEFGAGYLLKVASMGRKGVQIEAGLDALQSKVVQSLPSQDREPIALLASEIIGERTDDPEAAIKYAIDDYYAGKQPTTPRTLSQAR